VGTYSDSGDLAPFGGLAIDDTFAYAAFTDGNVLKCALSGCSSGWGLLQSGQNYLLSVAASSAGVVWNSANGTGVTAVAGCSPATCAQGVIPYASQASTDQAFQVAIDSSNVYFTVGSTSGGTNAVMACPAASSTSTGCGSGLRTVANATGPSYLAVAAGYAYWIDGVTTAKAVKRCSTAGCAGGQLLDSYTATISSGGTVVGGFIAADSANVYFVPGSVVECPNTGCAASGPLPLGAGTNPIAVDSSNVYWTTSSSLVRCAIGGCGNAPTTVVSGITPGVFTAVDATYVYFFQGTTLMKIAK
jgi:hypothetical protein